MKKILLISLCLVLIVSIVGCTNESGSKNAADFPSGPITFTVPWSAGGSSDSMVRVLAELTPKYLDTPANVVNRDGAGGTIATTEFVNAKADGHNIALEAVGVFTTQPFMREVKYSIEDFKPIIGLTTEPIVMVASKQSGFTSVEDMKASKESISYGFSGSGSLMQLSQEKFFKDAGIDSEAIPFDGGGPTITALLGGHIDIGAAHPGEIMQYVENGDLVPIGIFNSERDTRDKLKDIPTFAEQGFPIDMSVWKFLIVPKDTPDEVATVLYDKLKLMTEDEKFIEFCKSLDLMISPFTPEQILEKIEYEAGVNKELFGK